MENYNDENKFIRNVDEDEEMDFVLDSSEQDQAAEPKKYDMKSLIIKIVAIVAAVCLVVSSSVIIYHFADANKQRGLIETAQKSFDFDNADKNDNNEFVDFEELKKQNPDIIAWINIPGTSVNNPVYKTNNNDYYLNHNMLKQKNRYGALFLDYRAAVEPEKQSQNLTIYGHNMKDSSMFGSLELYRDLNFYKEHPTIQLKTLYDQSEYIIFAVMITNASASDDNGNIFNYTAPAFDIQDNFLKWTKEAQEKSLIKTDVEINKFDEVLTLSTCSYDFDNARFVIMAKKLTKDDEYDPSTATLNPNVKYPQAWYDKRGLSGYQAAESEDEEDESSESSNSFLPVWSDLTSTDDTYIPSTPKPSTPSPSSDPSGNESSSSDPSESTSEPSTPEPSTSEPSTSEPSTAPEGSGSEADGSGE